MGETLLWSRLGGPIALTGGGGSPSEHSPGGETRAASRRRAGARGGRLVWRRAHARSRSVLAGRRVRRGRRGSAVADARVEVSVGDIDGQVDCHEQERDEEAG